MQIRRSSVVVASLFAVAALATFSQPASAQQNQRSTSPAGPQVTMTVSAEARHGNEIPVITREDIVVEEGHDHDIVTKWVPAQGANSGLDLLILMDDSSGFSVDTQLQDLRAFINQLPPTTFVGVGYIQNGTVQMVQNFTQDHGGRVVVQFHLNRDGSISNMHVVQTDVGPVLSDLCQAAIREPGPYESWPQAMYRKVKTESGLDYREVQFTFFYEW